MIDIKKLIQAGVHFGHQRSRWCPKMRPFIWGQKNDVHLIDVTKTQYQLERAAKFLEEMAAAGRPILWVGTKKAAQDTIFSHARKLEYPYVTHRWIGGTLTNYSQVKKSVTKLLHFEDVLSKSEQFMYTKKELNKFEKLSDRLQKNVGGIRYLTWPLGAIVIVDIKKEHAALKEALVAGIPVVALVDTNSDPSGIEYVIPANDDAPRSIALLVDYLAEAAQRGLARAEQKPRDLEDAIPAQPLMDDPLKRIELAEEEEKEKNSARRPKAPMRPRGPRTKAA